jgi:hypothetical protein
VVVDVASLHCGCISVPQYGPIPVRMVMLLLSPALPLLDAMDI